MSNETKPAQPAAAAAAATPKKPSAVAGVVRIVVPALLAAGAAYGGTRAAAARTPAEVPHDASIQPASARAPGPTLPLDPFLVTLFDASKKPHPMKMSIAVEFDATTKEDLKTFVPRIRDGVLAYLRTLSHEQVIDPTHVETMRLELLERCKASGATSAEKILVTDFVVQ